MSRDNEVPHDSGINIDIKILLQKDSGSRGA